MVILTILADTFVINYYDWFNDIESVQNLEILFEKPVVRFTTFCRVVSYDMNNASSS